MFKFRLPFERFKFCLEGNDSKCKLNYFVEKEKFFKMMYDMKGHSLI